MTLGLHVKNDRPGRPFAAARSGITEKLGTVGLPAPGRYGMMSYAHEGQQYVLVQIASANHPGSLAALRLP